MQLGESFLVRMPVIFRLAAHNLLYVVVIGGDWKRITGVQRCHRAVELARR